MRYPVVQVHEQKDERRKTDPCRIHLCRVSLQIKQKFKRIFQSKLKELNEDIKHMERDVDDRIPNKSK